MKTMKMNTFLTGLVLLSSATMATAQQNAPTPSPARNAISSNRNVHELVAALPTTHASDLPASVYVNGQGFSYGGSDVLHFASGKDFKDEDLKSKEVSKEISVPKGGEIYIENSSRAIVVKTWDQPKVKVTTTIFYDGDPKLTDEEWLDKVNLSLKTLGTSVKIKSGAINSNGAFYSYNSNSGSGVTFGNSITGTGTTSSSGTAVFNSSGQNIGTKANLRRIVTVTVPAGSKLDIESKYADVTIPAGITDVNIDLTNGNLEADNLTKLVLRSKYSNINVGDIKTAEVEFNNGRFSAKNIDDLDIESKYSTIEMASAKKIVLRSTNDEYELEEAGEVRARKSYGNLRITKLNGSLDIDGINADVKVRKVGTTLTEIKVNNKYADVRIPLRETKNYAVDFEGNYSSVFGNFEKTAKPVTKEKETEINAITINGNTISRTPLARAGTSWDSNSPSKFTATVGDGKGLKIEMKCQNCTVDFK